MSFPTHSGYGKIERTKIVHLQHIERDMRDVKIEVFRFKYITYGAIIVFVILSDRFHEILRLL